MLLQEKERVTKMMTVKWEKDWDRQYQTLLESYGVKDGVKAISVYVISIGFLVLQGWMLKSNLSVAILTGTQIFFPVLDILLCFLVLWAAREPLSSVGLVSRNLKTSLCWGAAGAVPLAVLAFLVQDGISFEKFDLTNISIFMVGAVSEEILFRGYVQPRLHGLFHSSFMESFLNAMFFLAAHYPVRWVSSGEISFTTLSGAYVMLLLLLHFACDLVYKKTGCLWSAIMLHFLYNLVA